MMIVPLKLSKTKSGEDLGERMEEVDEPVSQHRAAEKVWGKVEEETNEEVAEPDGESVRQ